MRQFDYAREKSTLFHNNIKPYTQTRANGLILKSISTEEEVERLAAFNVAIHGDDILDNMTRTLILHHPETHPQEWLFVEDPTNGKVVSALSLIPWTLHYGNVQLKAGEMAIVGTDEAYRRQGLIRALNERFKQLLDEGEYDLSHIQGIPYYYRQFGYEYALPLEGGWELALYKIPDELPDSVSGFSFQQAETADIPTLVQLYDSAMRNLDISAVRSEQIWQYLLDQEYNLQGLQETWLIKDAHKEAVGYVRVAKQGFGPGLIVDEASQLPHSVAVAVLRWLKNIAIERAKPYIRLSMTETCPLIPAAQAWGAHLEWSYAWQIKLPNPARFLRHIAPVLEERVAESSYAGHNQPFIINLYRQAYELQFGEGRIIAVNELGFYEGTNDIRIPPAQFVPLVLGYKTREELQAFYPDVSTSGQSQYLVDVLFPKMKSFLHLIY